MLQTTQSMSKASRQIVNELNKYADTAGVQGFLVPAHVYMCDYMVIKYNTTAIINVIRSHISKIQPKKREYKHFTPIYWYKVVDNMLANKQGVCRPHDTQVYGEMVDYNAFNHITKMYLVDDYSVTDAMHVNRIVNTYTLADIVSACKTASQNGAYSMAYVDAVLRNSDSQRKAEELRIKMLCDKVEKSSSMLNGEVHKHTPIELAKSEYEYNKKREDVLLELLVNKMMGDMNR